MGRRTRRALRPALERMENRELLSGIIASRGIAIRCMQML